MHRINPLYIFIIIIYSIFLLVTFYEGLIKFLSSIDQVTLMTLQLDLASRLHGMDYAPIFGSLDQGQGDFISWGHLNQNLKVKRVPVHVFGSSNGKRQLWGSESLLRGWGHSLGQESTVSGGRPCALCIRGDPITPTTLPHREHMTPPLTHP